MVLGALDGVKEPVSVIRNALQNIVDPKERENDNEDDIDCLHVHQ